MKKKAKLSLILFVGYYLGLFILNGFKLTFGDFVSSVIYTILMMLSFWLFDPIINRMLRKKEDSLK